ncbi:MAG: nicotinamide mononucleotide transporter family protein [Rhizomicrobium sp.]
MDWLRARDAQGLARVEILTHRGRWTWLAVIAAATLAEGWYLARPHRGRGPLMDANTTALSVVAQYLLSVRKVENWVLWIVTDSRADRTVFLEGPLSDHGALCRVPGAVGAGPARMASPDRRGA